MGDSPLVRKPAIIVAIGALALLGVLASMLKLDLEPEATSTALTPDDQGDGAEGLDRIDHLGPFGGVVQPSGLSAMTLSPMASCRSAKSSMASYRQFTTRGVFRSLGPVTQRLRAS